VLGCGSVSAIAVAPRAGLDDDSLVDQIVFAGTSGGCVFRTRTALGAGGATVWTRLTTVGNGYVSSIAFDPTTANIVYVTHSTFGSVHVERSVDGGVTFGALDGTGSTLPDVPTHTLVVAPGNPSRLYVGTDVGVFSSDDGGENWSVENTGFANVITEALAVGQVGGVDHVFAFTHGRGVFRVALPASMADIATVQASVPAGAAVAGRPIAVTDTARNVGTVAASAGFAVTYALVPVSPAGTPTSPDIALPESRTVAALAGQASSQATTSIVLPSVPSGSYRIRVMADVAQQVAEDPAPQNNQRLTNTFTIVRPDLTVTSVTPALTAAPGGGLNVTHTLRNLAASPAHAPPSVTAFHLATNQSMASVIGALGNTSAPGVAAGATSAAITGSGNVVPPGTPPGRYFVIAQANATAAFAEVSTANNVLASSVAVLVGPDLLITSAAATPAGVVPGGNLSVTFTAKNQGGAPATFDVGFALVPVTTAGVPTGAPDVVLGTYGQAVSLAAGQTSAVQTKVLTLAASVPVGTYKVRVTADPDNAVTEASEANNSVLATALTTVAQSDLVVPSVTFAPAATRANGSVTITHLVRNLGGAPGHAPASISRLFLGAVNDSVAGAFDLGTVAVNPVGAGATQSASRLVTVPPGIAPGLYFALAVADDGGVVVESNEGNNRGASVTRLVVGPDLVVSAGLTPAGASPGSRVSVTHTIANRGGEAAGPVSVAFALVPVTATGVPTGAPAIALGPDRTGVVVPAGSAGASFVSSLPLPLDVDPGTYRVRLTADSGNVVAEADETNNTLLTTGVLTIARANLTVQSVTFAPAASRANGSVTVTHVVRNAASAPGTAVPTTSSLFLNTSASTSGALFLANVSVPQIPGGGSASVVKPVTVPLGTPPGLYFVVAQADADGTLIESEESNTAGSQARLVVGPDLTVSTATAAAGVATGANLSVSFTLRNVGGEAAGSFDVGFRLVPVTVTGVPSGDPEIPLGPNRTIAALAAGAAQALTSSLAIPAATVTGTYRVRVSADVNAVVSEASEANNELLTGLVRVARPDLTVPSVTFTPPAVATGGAVTVTHIVKNATAANGSAPASQSAIYLSQNASLAGVLGQLATVNVPALAPNGTTTLTRAVSVGNLSTGVYFFVVRADDSDAIVEENEGNNAGFSAVGLLVGPDAGVTAATTVTGAGPGTNVSVSYTLRNLGAAATGAFDVAFDVTPVTAGGVPNGTPIALGTARSLPGLAAGQTLSLSNQARLPADLAPGTYRIGVTLAGFSSSDANAANDRRLTSGVLTVVRPDLVMSAFTPPATLIAGRTASVTNSARNSATAPGAAGPFGVGVYLSGNGNSDVTGDTLVGNRSVSGLAAGGTSSVPIAIAVPASPGNFFLKALADFTDLVVEANESNNVAVKPVAVVPDVVRTNVTSSISFNIGPPSPTCFVQAFGLGQSLVTIATQTGASLTGGKITFFDDQGGADTITFSGTVSVAGNLSGTFTLGRAGGGGGSGSGSFTGNAFPGTPADPGALSLQLAGTFTVSGGGTCPVSANVSFNGSGPLTATSLVPSTLTAGDTGTITIGFTTTDPWPAGGELQVIFPAGFDPFFVFFVGATGPDGTFITPNANGQTVRLPRTDGSTFLPGSVSITLGGIRNPPVSGTTGSFSLATTATFGGQPINTASVPGVTLTPGALRNPSVMPVSFVAGATGNVSVGFDTNNPWPFDGTIAIDFPTGFDVSAATFETATGPPGAFAIDVSGQTVTLTRSGGFTYQGTGVNLVLGGIQNPAAAGTTGSFTLTLTDGGGAAIDLGTAPGVALTP
jgi:subtilase family serine protease